MLLAALLAAPAFADSVVAEPAAPTFSLTYAPAGSEPHLNWPSRPTTGSSGSSGSSASSAASTATDVANSFKKGKLWGWTYQPYVSPGGGVQINTSNGTSATSIQAGVEAGIKYSRKKWCGDLYIGGSYTTGDGLNGYDVHIGDEMGRREKYWGLTGGLTGTYDGYLYANGDTALAPAASLGIPVEGTIGPKTIYGLVGFEPIFVSDRSRQVDWAEAAKSGGFGFGHEFDWHVGLGIKLDWFTGVIGFEQHTTVAGVQNIPTISIGVGG